MNWDQLDWGRLERLRKHFLEGSAAEGPYWKDELDLAHYDLTYAQRIGWKWDSVLQELHDRGWQPRGGTLLDWGCGSGIASRKVLSSYSPGRFDCLLLWDHSPLASDFAEQKASQRFPELAIVTATPGFVESGAPIGLLILSHVLNELSREALEQVRRLILRAEAVLWTEPGTKEVAHAMQAIRDSVLETHTVLAPCTHALTCPLRTPGQERHWCHFFAHPPAGIQADADWVKFGQKAGIDLRSLPYSFLALQSKATNAPLLPPEGLSRVLGRPEFFKPYARVLSCEASGIHTLTIPKRGGDSLYNDLEKTRSPLVYRWRHAKGIIADTP